MINARKPCILKYLVVQKLWSTKTILVIGIKKDASNFGKIILIIKLSLKKLIIVVLAKKNYVVN